MKSWAPARIASPAARRVAEGGEHDDDRVRIPLAHHAQEIEPAGAGHPQVGEHGVEGAFASQLRESFGSGEGPDDLVALPLQHFGEETASRLVVVDQQKSRRSATLIATSGRPF